MESELPDKQSAESPEQPNQQSEHSVVRIELTPEFQQSLKDLAKRYRSIRSDIQTVIQKVQSGTFVGDRITGIGRGYVVFKVRVRNRDIQKGKSAGYRLIYQVESPTSVLLLTIYSKSDQDDISSKELRKLLDEFYGNDM